MSEMYNDDAIGNALHEAWTHVIEQFRNGRINSERALQAVLICQLQFALPDLDVLCEPTILVSSRTMKPDILVTNTQDSVVAAIELKYMPHGLPVFETDIKKLKEYASSTEQFQLTVNPATGSFDDRKYRFGSDCLLVFAVIGHHTSRAIEALTLSRDAGLGGRFLALTHAVGG